MDMKHKGFTLIEVLIVIAVIAVLASIAIVSYRSVRENGLDAKIRSAVKTAGDAAALAEARGKRITGFGPFNAPDGVQTLVPDYLKVFPVKKRQMMKQSFESMSVMMVVRGL